MVLKATCWVGFSPISLVVSSQFSVIMPGCHLAMPPTLVLSGIPQSGLNATLIFFVNNNNNNNNPSSPPLQSFTRCLVSYPREFSTEGFKKNNKNDGGFAALAQVLRWFSVLFNSIANGGDLGVESQITFCDPLCSLHLACS